MSESRAARAPAPTESRARFDGRAVVVTGVGRAGQAGETVVRAFAERGATVHCVDRAEGVHALVEEIARAGAHVVAHRADLTDVSATEALARRIASLHSGRIDAVAAIAGGFASSGPIATSDADVFARMIAINLTSAYATARAFAPAVSAARGAFVFATSASVMGGSVAGLSAYAASKGGLVQLMRALAQEGAASGMRANAVAPTAIRTAANLDSMGETRRYVEREEFAAAIVALCSADFARVTGQVFVLE